jgi:sn-glycerol 3-phosphate transport system substrate-binding protein
MQVITPAEKKADMLRTLRFRKTAMLAIGLWVMTALIPAATEAQQRVQVEFWHGLTQPLGGILEKVAQDFNASQSKYQVNATFKGSYPETMVAAIAAFRAGDPPHILQVYEVGTETMIDSGAIIPVTEVVKPGEINWDDYFRPIMNYYTVGGKLNSMPFNSSTAILYCNKSLDKHNATINFSFPHIMSCQN